ncbi:MAG: UDP-N-acetylmuramoyl-L-alanine--D-glutamate ligase [Candidatus Omnitrophica bacterium]|nr:UDP-N-acetylmuramoyl-L-alanine--D-glutamate ligase [Candidatus Omnitrophota bacterium]
MRNPRIYKDREITVIGLARSGLACANLLSGLGARVRVTDSKPRRDLENMIGRLSSKDIRVECGRHTEDFIRGSDLAVLSPGIPETSDPVQWALKHCIPVYSEIEIAWTLCPAPVIAITGSNGKTTTATLMGLVLEAAGRHAVVCGNIGDPFSGEVARVEPEDSVVLEVSSFQLERIKTFQPHIAVVTNLNPNHLDRYRSMEEYIDAKKRIFLNQNASDYLLLNAGDPASAAFARGTKAQVVYFNEEPGMDQNQAAVAAAAGILGIPRAVCAGVFNGFKGIEHRMEEVACIGRVTFVNDSKATTVESAMWALRSIPRRAVLIAGGKDKGLDYRPIRELAKEKLRSCVLIGQAAQRIGEAFDGIVEVEKARDLKDAVRKAFEKAAPGDTVLLSPMCSSYDMFSDYEERGRVFKQIVRDLEADARLTD